MNKKQNLFEISKVMEEEIDIRNEPVENLSVDHFNTVDVKKEESTKHLDFDFEAVIVKQESASTKDFHFENMIMKEEESDPLSIKPEFHESMLLDGDQLDQDCDLDNYIEIKEETIIDQKQNISTQHHLAM